MKTILSLGFLALIAVTALACASGSGRGAPSKISTAADRAATASPEAIPTLLCRMSRQPLGADQAKSRLSTQRMWRTRVLG